MQFLTWLDRGLLAAILAAAFVGKAVSSEARREVAALVVRGGLPVPERWVTRVVGLLLVVEAATALLLLAPLRLAGPLSAAVLLAVLTAGSAHLLVSGTDAPCRCFGVRSRPMGRAQVVRNAALTTTAALAAIAEGLWEPTTAAHPGPPALTLLAAAVGALLGTVVLTWSDLSYLLASTVPSVTPRGGTP